MKIKIIVVLFIVITFFGKAGFAQGNDQGHIAGLKMIVSTDKTTYLEGEVIWKEIKLIIDKSVVKLDYKPAFYPNRDLEETVTNSKNQGMPGWDPVYTTIGKNPTDYPDTIQLFDVLNVGIFEESPDAMHLAITYLPVDDYEFTATVNVAVKGENYKIKSEPYKFKVLKPEGDEALARQEYLEIFQLVFSSPPENKRVANKVDNFFVQYPNSVYIDQILRKSLIAYFIYYNKSLDEEISFLTNIIEKYPGFASNFERLIGLRACFDSKNDLDGFIKFINELKSKNKDNNTLNKVLYYLGIK